MSGFGDAEKLRAARELAQGFSRTKGPQKKNVGGNGLGPRQDYSKPLRQNPTLSTRPVYQQQHSKPLQQSSAPIASTMYRQEHREPPWQSSTSFGSSVPPPSLRNYSSGSSFSTGTARKSVIGSSGLDFIKASGTTPRNVEKPQANQAPIANEADKAIQQTETVNNDAETSDYLPPTSPQEAENAPMGNILDAFLSIVAKKPTIGQEIDTLASILPKAMDLNAAAPAASDDTLANGCSNSHAKAYVADDVPQTSGVETNQSRELDCLHSDKLSAVVATAVVSISGNARGQITATNGVAKVSVTKTKGLSASAWA
ncbi:hypothetical protein V8C35DRAFT_159813 [Trichoderma chlorosporum]